MPASLHHTPFSRYPFYPPHRLVMYRIASHPPGDFADDATIAVNATTLGNGGERGGANALWFRGESQLTVSGLDGDGGWGWGGRGMRDGGLGWG